MYKAVFVLVLVALAGHANAAGDGEACFQNSDCDGFSSICFQAPGQTSKLCIEQDACDLKCQETNAKDSCQMYGSVDTYLCDTTPTDCTTNADCDGGDYCFQDSSSSLLGAKCVSPARCIAECADSFFSDSKCTKEVTVYSGNQYTCEYDNSDFENAVKTAWALYVGIIIAIFVGIGCCIFACCFFGCLGARQATQNNQG